MLSLFSTVILGVIVWLIVYLISLFKPNQQQSSTVNTDLLPEIDERSEEQEPSQLLERSDDNKVIETSIIGSGLDTALPEQEITAAIGCETYQQFIDNEVDVILEEVNRLIEQVDTNDDNNLDLESPPDDKNNKQEVCEEKVVVEKHVIETNSQEFSDNNSQLIHKEVTTDDVINVPKSEPESNEIDDFFKDDDESEGLVHINKSRPKKPKNRPSVKSVFSTESSESSHESSFVTTSDDNSVIVSSTRFVETTEYTETKVSCVEDVVITSGDSISIIDFKNLDMEAIQRMASHDDSDTNERKKQELSGFVEEIVEEAVKQYSTREERHEESDINETEIVDQLFTDIITDESVSENFIDLGDDENNSESSFEKVVERVTRSQETVSHSTVRLSSIRLSSSELSSSVDMNLSPLSATIESITKPLFVKKCLVNKSVDNDCEENDDNCCVIDDNVIHDNNDEESNEHIVSRITRVSARPVFGINQSSLISEMREKQFKKTLKNQSVDEKHTDNNDSNVSEC